MSRRRSKPNPPEDASGDASGLSAPASDIGALRWALAEKLEAFVRQDAWPRCKRPGCKRARACRARGAECAGLPEQPEPTPQQWDKMLGDLKRALEQRRAALGAGP